MRHDHSISLSDIWFCLQIDFQDKKISVIERGKIGKAYDFHNVENYDSEVWGFEWWHFFLFQISDFTRVSYISLVSPNTIIF